MLYAIQVVVEIVMVIGVLIACGCGLVEALKTFKEQDDEWR